MVLKFKFTTEGEFEIQRGYSKAYSDIWENTGLERDPDLNFRVSQTAVSAKAGLFWLQSISAIGTDSLNYIHFQT